MTSTHNVLTTKLRDLLYNQCIGNTCCYSFLFFVCFFFIYYDINSQRLDDKVTWSLIQPMYCVVIRFCFLFVFSLFIVFFIFFYLSTGWIKVCKIRFVSTGENAENLARKAVPSLKVGMVSRLIVRKLHLSIQLTIQTWIERTIVFITYPIKRVWCNNWLFLRSKPVEWRTNS